MKKYRLSSTTGSSLIPNSTTSSTTSKRSSTTTTSSSSSSSTTTQPVLSSSTTTTTHGRNSSEIDIQVSLDCLKESYQECICMAMPKPIERRITSALIRGVPYEYFAYALMEAAAAPRPSWRYAEEIVSRCIREEAIPEALFWRYERIIPPAK